MAELSKFNVEDVLPPHSSDAERGLLGCLILSASTAAADLLEFTRDPVHLFYDLRHRRLAEVILTMVEAGTFVDAVTLGHKVKNLGIEREVGGAEYWSTHADHAPSAANALYYARILEEGRLRRMLLRAGTALRKYATDEPDIATGIDKAEREVLGLRATDDNRDQLSTRSAVIAVVAGFEDAVANRGQPRGLATGLPGLDRLLRGLRPGQLIVIGARPSAGKSALAGQIAEIVAVDGRRPVGFWSLEMTTHEILSRMITSRAKVPLAVVEDGAPNREQVERISTAALAVRNSPLHIYDRAGMTIAALMSSARRAQRMQKLELVIVDYCQLLHGDIRRRDTRTLEIAEITGALKQLAKELELPVILLSQLNREAAKEDREPHLSDLRDSGAIEQDADIVILIHPEAVKDGGIMPERRLTRLLIRKSRNGRCGSVKVEFNGPLVRFQSIGS